MNPVFPWNWSFSQFLCQKNATWKRGNDDINLGYVIYNLQYMFNLPSWIPKLQCFIRSDQIIIGETTCICAMKKKQDLIGIIWVHKKWSDNIEFLNIYRRETTCTRAMEKTAPYRHYLSTCKKTFFVVSKGWNWSHLNSNVRHFSKFSSFYHNFEQNCDIFPPISLLFCIDLN